MDRRPVSRPYGGGPDELPLYATEQAEPEATIDLQEGNLERIKRVGSVDLGELADLLVEQTDR
jgi:hypothetical protein